MSEPRTSGPWKRVTDRISEGRYTRRARTRRINGERVEKHFPKGTPIRAMQSWQASAEGELRQLTRGAVGDKSARAPTRTGGATKERGAAWLAGRKHLTSYGAEQSQINAAAVALGETPFLSLTTKDVSAAVAALKAPDPTRENARARRGYAPKYIKNILATLNRVHLSLTKQNAPWADAVKAPKSVERDPMTVSAARMMEVAACLLAQANAYAAIANEPLPTGLRPSVQRYAKAVGRRARARASAALRLKTRARFAVLTSSGARPIELMRTDPEHVDVRDGGEWAASNSKDGEARRYPLEDDLLAAWQAFVAADAWGPYDESSHAKLLRAAGWPTGVRPYNARHSLATELEERGADVSEAQASGGWKQVTTMRRFYAKLGTTRRIAAAQKRLAGRFNGWRPALAIVRESGV